MVKSMANIMLTWVSRFYLSFSLVEVLCNRPQLKLQPSYDKHILWPIFGTNSRHSEIEPEVCSSLKIAFVQSGRVISACTAPRRSIFRAAWLGRCGAESVTCRECTVVLIAMAAIINAARKEAQQMNICVNQGPVVRGVAKKMLVTPAKVTSGANCIKVLPEKNSGKIWKLRLAWFLPLTLP